MKYENFVFYGSWKEHLDGLQVLCGDDVVKEVVWQIVNYGTTKSFDTEDQKIVNIVNGMCRDLITSAKKRRQASIENGKQGGRPREHDHDAIKQMHKDGVAIQVIADTIGCSTRTVKRVIDSMSDEDEI